MTESMLWDWPANMLAPLKISRPWWSLSSVVEGNEGMEKKIGAKDCKGMGLRVRDD